MVKLKRTDFRKLFFLAVVVCGVLGFGLGGVNAGIVLGSPFFDRACGSCTPQILGGSSTVKNTFSCNGAVTDFCTTGKRLADYMCGNGFTSLYHDLYDCDGSKPRCYDGRCVECTASSDCVIGKYCNSNACVTCAPSTMVNGKYCTGSNFGTYECSAGTNYLCWSTNNCWAWQNAGTCTPTCGGIGQLCCGSSCNAGLVCSAGMCVTPYCTDSDSSIKNQATIIIAIIIKIKYVFFIF